MWSCGLHLHNFITAFPNCSFTNIDTFSYNDVVPYFLQVGLLGLGRSLQRDLNRIAEVADTSTPEGLSYVLTGNCIH